jgi:stage V sporulation protein R
MIATRGTPRVHLVDANAHNRQEMRLRHEHEGLDLQLEWAGSVLGNLSLLWGRAVHLDTVVENKPVTLTHDGTALRQSKRAEAG